MLVVPTGLELLQIQYNQLVDIKLEMAWCDDGQCSPQAWLQAILSVLWASLAPIISNPFESF